MCVGGNVLSCFHNGKGNGISKSARVLNTGGYRTQTVRVPTQAKSVFKSWLEPMKRDSPGWVWTTQRNRRRGYKRKLARMDFTFVISIVFSGE